ncbi:MAG: hypothetical protein JO031_16695 [Ktedonobacteraceae bacterium]|nr:hypothetical protein [Ktedonobacteraceae bacterium]
MNNFIRMSDAVPFPHEWGRRGRDKSGPYAGWLVDTGLLRSAPSRPYYGG